MAKRIHAPVSEGQRLLVALRLSQREIGAAVGRSHATAQRWLSGVTAPPYDARLRIQEVFGIDRKTWEQAPEAQTFADALSTRLRTHADAIAAAEAALEDNPLPDAADGLEELIRQCRAARGVPDVAPTILARIGGIEVRAVAERERLRGSLELALRSPEIIAWVAALFDKLEAHPLAMIELARAELEASDPGRVAAWTASYVEWRIRWAELVEAAENANAALRAVLPPGASFESVKPPIATAVAA